MKIFAILGEYSGLFCLHIDVKHSVLWRLFDVKIKWLNLIFWPNIDVIFPSISRQLWTSINGQKRGRNVNFFWREKRVICWRPRIDVNFTSIVWLLFDVKNWLFYDVKKSLRFIPFFDHSLTSQIDDLLTTYWPLCAHWGDTQDLWLGCIDSVRWIVGTGRTPV